MSDENTGGKAEWIQYAITTAIGVGWNVFDRWAQLQPILEAWVPLVSPFVYAAVGAVLGYMFCKNLDKEHLAEKDAECDRRIADALKPYEEKFDLDRFDVRQVNVMFLCYKATLGPKGLLRLDEDNVSTPQLIAEGVVEDCGQVNGPIVNDVAKHQYRLTPDWLRFVKNNLEEVEARAGEAGKLQEGE